jgi:hypothetical protein
MAMRRARIRRVFSACLLAGALVASLVGAAPPSLDASPASLKPGEFLWHPQAAPAGPLLLVVSVPEQRAYLYRNGVRIAVTTVSTGKPGNETPPGVFTVLQKHKEHFSNLYDDAPMPFMQRLTWSGVALHAGRVPGYPASHGCVRLPLEFARHLFAVSELGMTVVVTDARATAPALAHPGWLAPPVPDSPRTSTTGSALAFAHDGYVWQPDLAPSGPLTLLLSGADRRVRVLRNGVQIGTAPFALAGEAPLGMHVLQLGAGALDTPSRHVPGQPRLRWTRLALGAGTEVSGEVALDALYQRIQVDPAFARLVYAELVPGTTVLFTDLPAESSQDGQPFLETGAMPPAATD